MTEEEIVEIQMLVHSIHELLKGRDPTLIGAVLADLLSLWLGGHIDLDSKNGTHRIRAELLRIHIRTVEQMIPLSAKEIGLPW